MKEAEAKAQDVRRKHPENNTLNDAILVSPLRCLRPSLPPLSAQALPEPVQCWWPFGLPLHSRLLAPHRTWQQNDSSWHDEGKLRTSRFLSKMPLFLRELSAFAFADIRSMILIPFLCILPRDVRTLTFLPTKRFFFKPLKVKLLAGEQKATKFSVLMILGRVWGVAGVFAKQQTRMPKPLSRS